MCPATSALELSKHFPRNAYYASSDTSVIMKPDYVLVRKQHTMIKINHCSNHPVNKASITLIERTNETLDGITRSYDA